MIKLQNTKGNRSNKNFKEIKRTKDPGQNKKTLVNNKKVIEKKKNESWGVKSNLESGRHNQCQKKKKKHWGKIREKNMRDRLFRRSRILLTLEIRELKVLIWKSRVHKRSISVSKNYQRNSHCKIPVVTVVDLSINSMCQVSEVKS